MKTSVDAVSGVERKITVEIPADEVDRRIEQEFTELRRMVPVRGFRKGKAPMEMVKRMFRDSVEAEVSEHLVKESLTEVVKEKDLKILSLPGVEGAKVVPGKDFVFSATVEVVPEVEAKDYKGIPVYKEKVNVTDEDVAAAIERLRTPYAHFMPEEGRKAQNRRPGGVRVHGDRGRRNGGQRRQRVDRPFQRHPVREGVRGKDAGGRSRG